MPRARSRCGRPDCDLIAPCPVHKPQPWAGSNRRAELPSNWSAIRRQVLRDEPTCQLAYPGEWLTSRGPARCAQVSTDVDHIGDRHTHARANLRGVCGPCHDRRTAEQAAAGRAGRL